MASRAESWVVNLAGLVQGITLVTFPRSQFDLHRPTEYDLSNTQYGAMFIPQVVTAIIISLLGARLAQRFGLAGLGCSALLPLTISLGQNSLVTMSAAVAGGVIAFYQVGYGIAAFGVGPLVDRGVSLSALYGWTAVAAAAMAVLSFAVAARQASPRELHPRLAGHGQPADSGG